MRTSLMKTTGPPVVFIGEVCIKVFMGMRCYPYLLPHFADENHGHNYIYAHFADGTTGPPVTSHGHEYLLPHFADENHGSTSNILCP